MQSQHEKNTLVFDKERHVYTLNDRELVSVTHSLQLGGLIDTRWFTDAARNRGVAVHEAIFLDIHGDLYVDGLHQIIKPYVEAWFKFKTDTRFKPIVEMCELRQFHPFYFYAGTPDCLGLLNGRTVLIDVKTGDASTAGIQLAAYSKFPRIMCYQPDRFSLRLKRDGSYSLKKHDDINDWPTFISNLEKIRNLCLCK